MLRIRMRVGRGRRLIYTNADVIKDAAVNMLKATGAPVDLLIGDNARHWGVGAVCSKKTQTERGIPRRTAFEVVVSTIDPEIAFFLSRVDPAAMRKVQFATGEDIDMTGAEIRIDEDPVIDGFTTGIDAFCLTPILISRRDRSSGGKWHDDVRQVDLSAAVNARLSRIAGRTVSLTVIPDPLYVGAHQTHAVRVDIKTSDGKPGVVVGMQFPFVLTGPEDDLRLAWYAGLGERNRQGFGFFAQAA